MGKPIRVFLSGAKVYTCGTCGVHLTTADALVSKNFHSLSGKAYLFGSASNVLAGQAENRMLRTGLHTVADVKCCGCGENLGWTYISASEDDQQYKIGKYVLEKARMLKLKDEYCEQALRFEEMAGTTAAVPETRRENGSNSDGVDDDASLEEVANGSRRMRSGSYVVEAHGFQLIFQRPAGSELT